MAAQLTPILIIGPRSPRGSRVTAPSKPVPLDRQRSRVQPTLERGPSQTVAVRPTEALGATVLDRVMAVEMTPHRSCVINHLPHIGVP